MVFLQWLLIVWFSVRLFVRNLWFAFLGLSIATQLINCFRRSVRLRTAS